MTAVLFYESAADVLTNAPIHMPAHFERIKEFHARGDILVVGTFGDAVTQGSMGIFPTRRAVEAFVEGDPFVLEGVVIRWEIRDGNEILVGDEAGAEARAAGG